MSLPSSDVGVFKVDQLGIKDIDGYGHVWYGNYLKFFERGLQEFLGSCSVRQVQSLKYKRSVPWGAADSRIESYLVERPSPGLALVYQRWCVGLEEDPVCALCLTLVELAAGSVEKVRVMPAGERLLGSGKQPKMAMAVKNLQTGATKPSDGRVLGRFTVDRRVFADMVPAGTQGMLLVDVMDLFEQSRTETVGGQPGLKAFLDRGLALVVGQIDELVLSQQVQVMPSNDVVCEVTLLREYAERRCFDFLQRVLRKDGSEVARVRVQMCCVDPKQGALFPVPDDSWAEWQARMAVVGDGNGVFG